MKLTQATVEGVGQEIVLGSEMWQGGGDLSSLRLYRAHHPGARIYSVTYRGRSVWMTLKQFAIWREVLKYQDRGRRTTLKIISETTGASRATVSRFLKRLDFWRFIDCATIVGRGGGTYVFTRGNPFADADAWNAGARITMASRKKARHLLAASIKRQARKRIEPLLEKYRIVRTVWWRREVLQMSVPGGEFTGEFFIGNTDATLKRNFKKGR